MTTNAPDRSGQLRRSRDLQARRSASMRTFTYTVTFTGEEHALVEQAALLNRRMLDRGLEHELLDRALSMVQMRLVDAWKASAEGQEITAAQHDNWKE